MTAALASGSAFAGGRSDLVLAALESGRAQHAPGELLVQFAPNASETDRQSVRQGLRASREEVVRGHGRDGQGQLELLRLPPGLAIADAVRGLEGVSKVDFAEPNWLYYPSVVSNDTYITGGQTWGMLGNFGTNATTAWANGKYDCGSVYVGIIDEGAYFAHEDLAANFATNPGEIAGNLRDDDGNGYVDDVRGWDFDANDSTTFDGTIDDHGTHVAGTIGAAGGNGKGVAGVCWSVKMLNAKFLGRRGGTTANGVKAIDYFTDLKTRHGLNLVATNNSWGGGGFSQAVQDAISRAEAKDILFIAAAGNDAYNNDTTASYPSNYPNANVIAVASIDKTGVMSSFSQWGPTTVDLGAPGGSVASTVPTSTKGVVSSGYAYMSGTSMATPHVTGAAALYKAIFPGATGAQIKSAIMSKSVPTPSLSGKTVTGGRLDVSGF